MSKQIVTVHNGSDSPSALLTNGIGSLLAEVIVEEELNGPFTCTISSIKNAHNADQISADNIIKAMTPRGKQLFRIFGEPETTLEEINADGQHISYDLANDAIVDSAWTGKTGSEALTGMLTAGSFENRFSGSSDIGKVNNTRITRMSIMEALMNTSAESENCFLSRWGGEALRDNFNFSINQRIGQNRGFQIRFGKNMTGLEITGVNPEATRMIPTFVSADGGTLKLPETYIDSPKITNYKRVYLRPSYYLPNIRVNYADPDTGVVAYPTLATAQKAVRDNVQAYYADGADVPKISVSVTFASLTESEEYKQFSILENVQLGDDVYCVYGDMKLNLRVVAYKYNANEGKMISIKLGVVPKSIINTLWAQDLNLSALKDKIVRTIKEGEKYNDVYINHGEGFVAADTATDHIVHMSGSDGFIAEGTVDGTIVRVEMSPDHPFRLSLNNRDYIYVKNGLLIDSIYDINEDGVVDKADLDIVQSYILNPDPVFRANLLALYPKMDVTLDGKISSSDLTMIARTAKIRRNHWTQNYTVSGGTYLDIFLEKEYIDSVIVQNADYSKYTGYVIATRFTTPSNLRVYFSATLPTGEITLSFAAEDLRY